MAPLSPLFAGRTERTIATARVVLGASSLFAVWVDPAEPQRFVELTYALHGLYVLYAIVLAFVMWNRSSTGPLPVATHVIDVLLFSVFQYLTLGPSSPFFMYFIFSLFGAALRWDWRATMSTAVIVVAAYVIMGAWMSRTLGPTEFELNRFLIRAVYLAVTGALLAFLGQHELRLRAEIERLARWPSGVYVDDDEGLKQIIGHAGDLLGARAVVCVWESREEPWRRLAEWRDGTFAVQRVAPGAFTPLVPPALTDATYACDGVVSDTATIQLSTLGAASTWRGLPVHADILPRLSGRGLVSAPFQTDRLEGRVFFTFRELDQPTAELLSLTAVVAREVGASLDRMASTEQMRTMAAREQRIRLARDLHDGVLQSLTGIRYELQHVATTLHAEPVETVRDRLLATERALAIEQRELRLFISELKPESRRPGEGLPGRLESLRDRMALEWKLPVSIQVSPESGSLPDTLADAVTLMTHEAIVNAMKHAQPTRVAVDVRVDGEAIHLTVSDDGHGFPFQGSYDHESVMADSLGPASLRERAASLGGRIRIESGDSGSRIEIHLPIVAARGA